MRADAPGDDLIFISELVLLTGIAVPPILTLGVTVSLRAIHARAPARPLRPAATQGGH